MALLVLNDERAANGEVSSSVQLGIAGSALLRLFQGPRQADDREERQAIARVARGWKRERSKMATKNSI